MEGKSKLTQEEKRLKRIAQLKAMLQQEEAKQNQEERKRRTGQLVAFGFYIEEFFKTSDDEAKKRLEESIKKHLSGRNLERALDGIKRLSK
ncbi:MAG: hypothetical protein ACLSB9_33065 [Hydrogeniiclostridium mannosilyticum]|jgi:hypothetical protein